jgi:transmembrane sensor
LQMLAQTLPITLKTFTPWLMIVSPDTENKK